MVLSDSDLKREMAAGELEIEPFSEPNLTPNGYDLTVESVLVPSTGQRTGAGTAAVPPGCWFVVGTRERVRLGRGLAAQLWLRSSFARRGVLATFGKIDAGFDGTLTVTALNASPSELGLPVGERFCQMVVERLDSPAEKAYAERSGRFQHQRGITLEGREEGAAGSGQRAAVAKRRPPSTAARCPLPAAPPPTAARCPLPAPLPSVQPCRDHGCDLCCRATEMPLTREDVGRIRELGFDEKEFVEGSEGWLRLRNTAGGLCVFLRDGLCSIYPHRPGGCRLYPAVFDIDAGRAVLDPECPHRHGFGPAEASGPAVRRLVDRLRRERRDRRRRRAR